MKIPMMQILLVSMISLPPQSQSILAGIYDLKQAISNLALVYSNDIDQLTCSVMDTEYRLIYRFDRRIDMNVSDKTFESYSADKPCPWVYSLWAKNKSEHVWTLLGPFLPCLNQENYPVLDLAATREFVKGDSLQWVIRERFLEDFDWCPCHLRPIKANGRAWLCSTPLSAYASDLDNDGFSDIEEAAILTNPQNPDSDGDGITDGQDSSPHGWFKDTADREAMNIKAFESVSKRGPFYRVDQDGLLVLYSQKSLKLRPQLKYLSSTILALDGKEEELFRNRNGASANSIIPRYESSISRSLFFGLIGITGYELGTGRGSVIICVRTLKKEWKPILSLLTRWS